MDEVVRLQALDGVWEVGGADRARGVWPEGVNCTWDKWGPRSARFALRREPGAVFPDLTAFTPVEIEKGGGVWEGFIEQTPGGDDRSLSVEALGWQDHGDDDVYQKAYVHARLADWVDWRTHPRADLTAAPQVPVVEAGEGAMLLGWRKDSIAVNSTGAWAYLDLGPGCAGLRVSIDYEAVGTADANYQVYVRGADDAALLNQAPIDDAIAGVTPATGTVSASFDAPHRYVAVVLWRAGATSAALTADRLVRVTGVRIYADAAYESGDQSVLTATDVLKDGLRRCPLWSQDDSRIEQTAFAFPDFAASEPRTFREYAALVQMVHRYLLKLERGRQLLFRPVATVPLLTALEGPGLSARDLSKNASRDLYNRSTGRGSGEQGEPVQVSRFAAQQPGVTLEAVSSPAPGNPSFATDTSTWSVTGGTITRDTTTFDSGPAAGRFDTTTPGAKLVETFSGTFQRGVLYVLRFRVRVNEGIGMTWRFGSLADEDYGEVAPSSGFGVGAFVDLELAWVPQEDRTGVTLEFTYGGVQD